jgi:flagellar basal body-associated protein FliL
MESISPEVPENPEGTPVSKDKAPGKTAVMLFITAIIVTVVLVLGGVGYTLWHGNHALSANNQQWCIALTDLTQTPVSAPADPAKNPSRVFAYKLYTDFTILEKKFGCE